MLDQLIMIILLAVIGYLARKTKLISDGLQTGLSSLVLNIAVPCSVLAAANKPLLPQYYTTILWVLGGAIVYHLGSLLLSHVLARPLRIPQEKRAVFQCLVTYSNVAFIGYPIIMMFLPETGVFFATFFIIIFNLTFFSYGMAALAGEKKISFRAILHSIPTLASLGMIVIYLLQIKFPTPLQNTLQILGDTCTPLSMLAIGGMLAEVRLRELITTKLLYLTSALRLVVMPLLVFLLLKLLPLPQEAAIVLLVMSALPAGATTAIMAQQIGKEEHFASEGVMHSTLLFAITLPIVGWLIQFL